MYSLLFGIMFSTISYSDAIRPGFCSSAEVLKLENEIPVAADINYFMRSSPQTKELCFATNLNKNAPVNKVLSAKTGKISDVAGFIDPVLSPDGSILATPIEKFFDPVSGEFVNRLNRPFYYLEAGEVKLCIAGKDGCEPTTVTEAELRSGKVPFKMMTMGIFDRDGNELLIDSQVNSTYQTFGQFISDSANIKYRLLYETSEGLAIRDYQRLSKDGKVDPAGKPKILCAGQILVLPSLSKDGRELSAFDPVANETRVYEIGESGDGCKIKEKFPGMLGKVDFSPDRKKIAFHIDHASATRNSIFEMPGKGQDLAAFVYDRDKKSFRLLVDEPNQQSYFPVFLSDDELALVTALIDSKGKSHSFAVSIGRLQTTSETQCDSCMKPDGLDGQKAAVIGAIVNEKCRQQTDYNFKSSIMSFSRLSAESCRSTLRSCNSLCLASLKQKILKQISADVSSSKGKYRKAAVLWNHDQIAELQSVDEICEKIEPASSSTTSPLSNESEGKR